jgi:hypothetical protein
MKFRTRIGAVALGVAALGVAGVVTAPAASAHPAGASAVLVTVHAAAVELELQLPMARLAEATGIPLESTDASVLAHETELDRVLLDGLAVRDADGDLRLTLDAPAVERINDLPTLVAQVTAAPADGSVDGDLRIRDEVIISELPTHRSYVFLVSDLRAGAVSESGPELIGIADAENDWLTLERSGASLGVAFLAMMRLGMQHIAEGPDHVLFLLTLLLAAPMVAVGRRWSRVRSVRSTVLRTAGVVSAFTVGHAISLALVSFGVVRLPTTPIELLVAASIVVAAAHAVRPLVRGGEVWVAGIFGLVHGTAFATTILALGLDVPATLLAVIAFNVGIELAQFIAVALVLPLLILLARTPYYAVVRWVTASAASLTALAWIVGILTGGDSVLTPVFAAVSAAPLPVYALLASCCVGVWLATRRPSTA